MEELRKLLNNIDDSYFEFVSAMEHYAQKNAARLEMLTAYIKRNSRRKIRRCYKVCFGSAGFCR